MSEQHKFKNIIKHIHNPSEEAEEEIGWEDQLRVGEKVSRYFDLILEKNHRKLKDLYQSKRQDLGILLEKKRSKVLCPTLS